MTRTRPQRPAGMRSDSGSATVELVILTPIFGLLLLAVVAVGRVQNARADVEGAARSAARDLSIARDPAASVGRVRSDVASMIRAGSPGCRTFTFTPTFTPDTVTVTIACEADLQDAALLPFPGHLSLTGTASEIIDRYKETAA